MNRQHMTPQQLGPKRKYATWVYWLMFALMLVVTAALVSLVIWLFTTQKLDQFSTEIGIMAAIAALISTPLIFFFTVFKKPESDKEKPDGVPPPQPPSVTPSKNIDTSTNAVHEQNVTPSSPIWNVPYRRNPFFTGREHLLTQLRKNLTTKKATAITQAQAVNGLGGIGKTDVVIEYAYRYRSEYSGVFWLNATSRETLFADMTTIAKLLHLPIIDERDQEAIVSIVKSQVAAHVDYLLIYDNADDLSLLDDFLPLDYQCHILITTRDHAARRLAVNLEVAAMDKDEGIQMLLRRAGMLKAEQAIEQIPQHQRDLASQIVQAMDGLPLALDQAGAYMERTQCTLAAYLETYQQRHTELLQQRGDADKAHPNPLPPPGRSPLHRSNNATPLPPTCCGTAPSWPRMIFLNSYYEMEPLNLGHLCKLSQRRPLCWTTPLARSCAFRSSNGSETSKPSRCIAWFRPFREPAWTPKHNTPGLSERSEPSIRRFPM